MNRTRFAGADLRDVEAYGGVFSSSNFAGADLTNASFVGAYLEGANFSGATLTGTNFSGAELARATGLTQGQLNRACGDDATDPAGQPSHSRLLNDLHPYRDLSRVSGDRRHHLGSVKQIA